MDTKMSNTYNEKLAEKKAEMLKYGWVMVESSESKRTATFCKDDSDREVSVKIDC
jgi:oligoendopeptidase F